ncbi:hypothetical protein JCM19239_1471 [Vibrio variabilis]|uniref:Uncharacterized protein n=1 Tax=Vibrio variabilis TaxID=990271 RepID=A0ABQ0JG48_9VIBR|nr:hypothetical protein JCM19239_1471 [Vibrio variabilis]
MWTVNANGYVKPEIFTTRKMALVEIEKLFEFDRDEAAAQGDWSGIDYEHVTLSKDDEVIATSGLVEVEGGFDINLIHLCMRR